MVRLGSLLKRQGPNLILIAILTGIVLDCLAGPDGPRDLATLSVERARLVSTNDQLRNDNARMTLQIGKLRSDSIYLQGLIRLQLGYARPDEFVYYFRSDSHPPQ
jgi:cell division protein FtsB